MYWINIESLKADLQTGRFTERDAVPYIIADGILMSVFALADGYESPLDFLGAILGILAVIYGTWFVFNRHNSHSRSSFLMKYIALGWVVSIRCLLVLVPLIIVLTIPVAILGNAAWINLTSIIWAIIFYFVYYYLLGKHVSET